MMRSFCMCLAAVTLVAAPAAAQSRSTLSPYVNATFGFQSQSQDLNQSSAFPLYDETATFEVDHAIEGGPLFDVGGGVRVWKNLSIGVAYSNVAKHTRDVTVTASVPSPIFTDTFRASTATATGLDHAEQAVHLQALWHIPVTMELDVTIFGRPTFFTVKDDLVGTIDIAETGGDFSTVNIQNVSTLRQTNKTTGFHVGIDGRYMFLRNVGVGAMLRYSRGSVDLETPAGGDGTLIAIDAGGLQVGAGLRFRF